MKGTTIKILHQAISEGYAVGAFNTFDMEFTQGIVRAARELNSPCIVQVTPSSLKYAGPQVLGSTIRSVIKYERKGVPIGFHLDHGKTFDDVVTAIEMGVDSVMIDASTEDLSNNIKITKRVVEYAHQHNVSVQAELGRVPYVGRDGQTTNWEDVMTNPEEAKKLVEETNVDALAVGIGNAHGFFREREQIDWDRLNRIKELLPDIPLIVHGASDWRKDKVDKAVAGGVVCFNIDTDLRLAFINALCNQTSPKCDFTDPRKALGVARDAVRDKVMEKITMFKGEI